MDLIRGFTDLGRHDVDVAGGKGANLGELTRSGFPVPPGFVLTTAAYREFVASSGFGERLLGIAAEPDTTVAAPRIRELFASAPVPDAMAKELLAAASRLGDGPVAVRSSATAEDLEGASFAGQQDTYLNVRGDDALFDAVRRCWASLWTDRAMAYRARLGIAPADVALAVVVQAMVAADAAGVMFTANPTTGRRDEVVVSAAWGLGEAVVSGAVTTDDVVVDPATGVVRSRTTAQKAVMTVPTGDGTEDREVPAAERGRAVLDDAAAVELARLGAAIATHYGAPQDIEWARAGGAFAIVQSRPITALPAREGPVPTEWPVPGGADDRALYVRASIVEQLPDPLTPLFAELVDPSVSRTLPALMREFLGDVVHDGEITLPTINGYAYYRYDRALFMRLTLSSLRALPKLGSVGPSRWREVSHPKYQRIVAEQAARSVPELTDAELLDGVITLLDGGTEYYTAVQAIIPLAASSEVALTWFYDRAIRRHGDPAASTLLLGFESAPIRAEMSLHDLAAWTRERPALAEALLAGGTGDVLDDLPAGPDADEWHTRLRAHLDAFGHATYNMDFANAVPADDPAPLLETLRFYLRGGGADPRERQARSAQRRDDLAAALSARLDPARRAVFERLLRWAQATAPVREDALADIGLAWPQLRRMLRELGRRLLAAGAVEHPDDVFWLRSAEILGHGGASYAATVAGRQEIWRGQRRATPPQTLPKGTLMDRFESFLPAASTEQTGNVLRGTRASAGQVTAPARVLGGPSDFGRMQPGDVLVASITTPAWTSLFAMASAVVTDIGGPLSHSSIVAREYGIPAVLGTAVATRRIPDGARVLVDGDAGTVTLVDEPAEEAEPEPPGRGRVLAVSGVVGAAAGAAAVVLARRRSR